MELVVAGLQHMEALVRLRLDFFRDWEKLAEEDAAVLEAGLRRYYEKHLPLGDFVGVLALEGDEVAGSAYLSLEERPPNPQNPLGVYGYVSSVFVYPAYRRRGLARLMMQRLTEEGKARGVGAFHLLASQQGEGLYLDMGYLPYKARYLADYWQYAEKQKGEQTP